ncbi:hypothetical protein ABBQ32_013308 [Trebouxia sp. C0010 RCD-2024]
MGRKRHCKTKRTKCSAKHHHKEAKPVLDKPVNSGTPEGPSKSDSVDQVFQNENVHFAATAGRKLYRRSGLSATPHCMQALTTLLTLDLCSWGTFCLAITVLSVLDSSAAPVALFDLITWVVQAGVSLNLGFWRSYVGSCLDVALTVCGISAFIFEGCNMLSGPITINEAENMSIPPASPKSSKTPPATVRLISTWVQKPPSSIAADHVKHAKEQQTSADIGPLRSADSKTPIQPCDTSLADHTPNTREHLIKSFSGQPGSTDAQPLPAKKTNAKTKPKKTSTQTSAPMTNSSNTSRKAAPAQSINSTPLAAKRTAKADEDDAYLLLVKALVRNAMGATPAAKQNICSIMAGLLRAVPAWMLDFGTTHNPGCSARGGFEAFLRLFHWNAGKDGSMAVLDSARLKSMGLLLRTFVAASLQEALDKIYCGQSDLLMAKDILRMTSEAGMPEFFREVPEWHLSILYQKFNLIEPACG